MCMNFIQIISYYKTKSCDMLEFECSFKMFTDIILIEQLKKVVNNKTGKWINQWTYYIIKWKLLFLRFKVDFSSCCVPYRRSWWRHRAAFGWRASGILSSASCPSTSREPSPSPCCPPASTCRSWTPLSASEILKESKTKD